MAATVEFSFIDGLKIGDETLRDVVLRELSSADIFKAAEEAEKIVKVGEGKNASYEFVASAALMAQATLRRQIQSIGNFKGPLSVSVLGKLTPKDLALLERWSLVLEGAITPAEVGQRGRPDTPAPGG